MWRRASPAADATQSICRRPSTTPHPSNPPQTLIPRAFIHLFPASSRVFHPHPLHVSPHTGFSIGHPARAKRHRHPCRCPLRGLIVPDSPPHRGVKSAPSPQPSPPRSGGEGAKSKSESQSFTPRAFRSGLPLRTECAPRWRAPLMGPLCSGGWAEEKPEGWPAWMPASLSSAQDVLSTNPVARTRTLRTGCPQGAEAGWPSLWLLSLGHPRESGSRSAGVRKLCFGFSKASRLKPLLQKARASRTTEGSPLWTGAVRRRRGMLRKAMLHGTSRKWLIERPLVGDLAAMANAKMWPVQVISSLRWRDGGLTMP